MSKRISMKRCGVLGALLWGLAGSAFGNTESLELSVGELDLASRRMAPRSQRATASYDGVVTSSPWLVSGGAGVNLDPSGFLLSAQFEYVDRPWLFYGPFADLTFVSGGLAFTGGVSIRALLGSGRLRPAVEAGAGLTFASGGATSIAFHFHFGLGIEYRIRPGISLATMFKPTFNPPIDNFWLSWPMIIGRFAL